MSKALKGVAIVAGAVALVAGTLATGGALGVITATGIAGLGSFSAIASVAGVLSAVSVPSPNILTITPGDRSDLAIRDGP